MKNQKIEISLRSCELLSREKEIDPKVEELLTKAILIEICVSFNEEIKSLLSKKLSEILDESIRDFAWSWVEIELKKRNPNYDNIKGLLGKFGSSYKYKFNEKIQEIEDHKIVINSYNSLLTNRNHAAHSQNIKVTLNQVREYYEKAHFVLDCLQSTLGV